MKKEFREVYENIKPDEELLMRALDLTDKNAPKSMHIAGRVISCLLCLAVFVGAGIGVRGSLLQISVEKMPESEVVVK